MSSDLYDSDYFLRGKQTGKSLYENYRWMPELTVPMCESIAEHCGMEKGQRILDFGCARGYIVKALRGLGYDAFGLDISKWAIDNADPDVSKHCSLATDHIMFDKELRTDWIIAKDVLEHIPYVRYAVTKLLNSAVKGVFVVVPLSEFDNVKYVIEEYEADKTHIQRHPLNIWVEMFLRHGWKIEASYRVPGVKDNYYKSGWEKGNGFITARRV